MQGVVLDCCEIELKKVLGELYMEWKDDFFVSTFVDFIFNISLGN